MPSLFLLGAAITLFVSSSSQFDDEGIRIVHSRGGRFKRQMTMSGAKWANNTVSYQFQKPDGNGAKVVRAAMDYIGRRTCVRFKEDRNAAQKMIISESGKELCKSDFGAPGSSSNTIGTQTLFSKNCLRLGNAVQELFRSLGLFYEHNRLDRDNFLTVEHPENFKKQPANNVYTYVPFQYGSVMMHGPNDNNGKREMTPKYPNFEMTMGNKRVGFYDIKKINNYYNCKCEKELECGNGGYTNPNDCSKCICPSGYFGNHCYERPRKNSYELAADDGWQKKTITFNYEFTGDNYAHFSSSFAYINAPNDKTVEVHLVDMTDVVCEGGCNSNGVEVKTNEDIRSVSPIVCCKNQTFSEQVFTSKNNPTIIEFYSSVPKPSKVSFLYRYV